MASAPLKFWPSVIVRLFIVRTGAGSREIYAPGPNTDTGAEKDAYRSRTCALKCTGAMGAESPGARNPKVPASMVPALAPLRNEKVHELNPVAVTVSPMPSLQVGEYGVATPVVSTKTEKVTVASGLSVPDWTLRWQESPWPGRTDPST